MFNFSWQRLGLSVINFLLYLYGGSVSLYIFFLVFSFTHFFICFSPLHSYCVVIVSPGMPIDFLEHYSYQPLFLLRILLEEVSFYDGSLIPLPSGLAASWTEGEGLGVNIVWVSLLIFILYRYYAVAPLRLEYTGILVVFLLLAQLALLGRAVIDWDSAAFGPITGPNVVADVLSVGTEEDVCAQDLSKKKEKTFHFFFLLLASSFAYAFSAGFCVLLGVTLLIFCLAPWTTKFVLFCFRLNVGLSCLVIYWLFVSWGSFFIFWFIELLVFLYLLQREYNVSKYPGSKERGGTAML